MRISPFHQMGRFKWERLGLAYSLATVEPPNRQLAEQTCELFRAEGLTAY